MPKLVLVQVLRALAALSVAMLHAQHDAGTLAARLGQGFSPIEAFPWEAGVDVFFVISGFIMVYASRRLFGTPDARHVFLSRRIARIVPIYWAVTTLYLILALIAPAVLNAEFIGWWRVLASYFFIPVARPDGLVQPLYGLGWTLNYEMFFYALFLVAIVRPQRSAVFALVALFGALVALGLIFRPLPQPFGFWSDPILLEFVYGMALGLLYTEGARLSASVRLLLAATAIALLVFMAVRFGIAALPYRVLAYGIPAAMLVAALAFGRESEGEASPLARTGALIGDASYALYLIHPFVIRAGREIAWRTGLGAIVGPWGFVLLVLTGAAIASVLVYRLFERHATALVRRILKA